MWLFSKQGFYSVVKDKYCSDGELMIRARVRIDLERLLDKITSANGDSFKADILTLENADYRYRMKIKVYQWVKYVAKEAAKIDYENVKETITWHEPGRSTAYYGCWQALYTWQEGQSTDNHRQEE